MNSSETFLSQILFAIKQVHFDNHQTPLLSDWLGAGGAGDRILGGGGSRFSAPVQTGPGSHPVSCTMGTGSFPGVKSGQGVRLTPHPF